MLKVLEREMSLEEFTRKFQKLGVVQQSMGHRTNGIGIGKEEKRWIPLQHMTF